MEPEGPSFEHMGAFLGLDGPVSEPKRRAKVGRLAWSLRFLLLSVLCFMVVAALAKDPGYVDPNDVVEPSEGDMVVIKVDNFGGSYLDPFYGDTNSSAEEPEVFLNNPRVYVGNAGERPVSTENVKVHTTVTINGGVSWFTSEFQADVLQPRQAEVLWTLGPNTFSNQNGTVNFHVTIVHGEKVIDDYEVEFALENGVIKA